MGMGKATDGKSTAEISKDTYNIKIWIETRKRQFEEKNKTKNNKEILTRYMR